MARLSICIPTRNRAGLLARHLAHISRFEKLDYEVVVSDNCSIDNTAEVVEAMRPHLKRLYYVRQEKSLNFYETMIAACNLAAGDFAMYAADDDFAVEDGLLRAVQVMSERPEISAVYGAWEEWLPDATAALKRHGAQEDMLLGARELVGMFSGMSTPEIPIFRVEAFRRSHLPVQHQYAFDFYGASLFLRHGPLMLIKDTTMRVTRHLGQESNSLFRPDILQCYLGDYEMFLSQIRDLGAGSNIALIVRSMTQQYMTAAERAVANKEYLQARTLFMRAAAYRLGDSEARLATFEGQYMVHCLADTVKGFAEMCQPVRRILVERGDDTRPLFMVLPVVMPRSLVEEHAGEDLAGMLISEEDLVITREPATLAAIEARRGYPLRKHRSFAQLTQALRSVGPVPLKVKDEVAA